jgi:hypothetical protein
MAFDRLKTRESEPRKEWVDRIRSFSRLAANDLSEIVGLEKSFSGYSNDPRKSANAPDDRESPVLTDQYFEGMSNLMRQHVGTIAKTVAYKLPDIQVEGIDQTAGMVTELYLLTRLGPPPFGCDGATVMRKALDTMLIGGLSFPAVGFRRGMPVIEHFAPEDVLFDDSCRTYADMSWVSVRRVETLGYWLEQFPSDADKFRRFVTDDESCYDTNVDVEFYWDIEGESGHSGVWVGGSDDGDGCIEWLEENPFFYEVEGYRFPFLPVEPMVYQHTPGARYPSGMVEDMLPHQLRLWRNERAMHQLVRLGKPRILVNAENIRPEYRKDLLRPDDVEEVLVMDQDADPAKAFQIVHGLDIPSSLMADMDRNERQLVGQSGVNPYASGATTPGVRYSSEAIAINENSDLTSQSVSSEYGRCWRNLLKKFLAVAIQYDDSPVRIVYDDVSLDFGENNPIAFYLDWNAQIIVQESGTQFETRTDRVSRANQKLQFAMSVGQMYPQALPKAASEFLEALGERNPGAWMEQPKAPMVAGAQDIVGGQGAV